MVPELAEVDALPGSQIQLPVCDRNRKADSEEGALRMCRHVIRPFHGVFVVRLSFLYHMVKDSLHVGAHVRIVVLVMDRAHEVC